MKYLQKILKELPENHYYYGCIATYSNGYYFLKKDDEIKIIAKKSNTIILNIQLTL